jgi:Flp pilus assembly protein TadD
VAAGTTLATLLLSQGETADAQKEYERVLSLDPRAAVAANNLAWLYVSSGQNLDQALQLAQTARELLPNDADVSDTLGWIYVRKNMASLAIPHLESSVQKASDNPSFQYHLGMAYLQLGDTEKANTALTRALTLKPDFDGAADARKALDTIKG